MLTPNGASSDSARPPTRSKYHSWFKNINAMVAEYQLKAMREASERSRELADNLQVLARQAGELRLGGLSTARDG